ncbi:hypothetical protein PUN28_006441 [Cardiocondyla obscurior]|uniref:Uncharacterized protein n=1 Tax=Cardiocondyla obscurior TaxID=286306 RepID=A0AAW2GBJ3_9HYME
MNETTRVYGYTLTTPTLCSLQVLQCRLFTVLRRHFSTSLSCIFCKCDITIKKEIFILINKFLTEQWRSVLFQLISIIYNIMSNLGNINSIGKSCNIRLVIDIFRDLEKLIQIKKKKQKKIEKKKNIEKKDIKFNIF